MISNSCGIVFGVSLLLLLVSGAFGHSYLTSPISRSDQTQSNSGCRGPACLGPCDIPLASATRAPIEIQRGATINPQWPRNNHAGGFIRFAWAQTSQSDSASAFDDGVNTIFCHEIGGCQPSDPSDPNGGDTGPADGSVDPCQTTITVPPHLTNGEWTLQWAWFGGAFALGDYYSCVDYTITGGPSGSAPTPLYHGGDYSNPTNTGVCKFFNTDRLHECVDEPCSNPIYPSEQQETGPAFGIQVAGGSVVPNIVITTHQVPSVSSSSTSSSSSSSHQPSPATTAHNQQSAHTTGHSHSSSSSSSSSSSTSSSSSSSSPSLSNPCTTGFMQCLTSETFSTCAHESWGVSQSCAPGTTCHPNGNYIYCGF